MRDLFHECGYETELQTLSANDYGVPQNRKRIILVGRKGKSTGFYPDLDKSEPSVLVEEIFSDLPTLAAGEGRRNHAISSHTMDRGCMMRVYGMMTVR